MIVTLEKDENGDLVLPLSDELMKQLGWEIGDTIEWIDNKDGTWSMRKKEVEKELVLVETISLFRMRYVVEVPKGKKEWALDTVTLQEAEEMSQYHVGEDITSHRVISEEEFLRLHDEDNDYLKGWTNEQKQRCIHRWIDDEAEANKFAEAASKETLKDIEHSEHWYDRDRNR